MSKTTLILLAVATIFAVQVSSTIVQDCKTGAINSNSVKISSCTSPPCEIKRGNLVHLTVAFTPTSRINSLTARVTVKRTGEKPVSLEGLDGSNACDNIYSSRIRAETCPLKSGVHYVYDKHVLIPANDPVGNFRLHWALQYGRANVACFEVDGVVV